MHGTMHEVVETKIKKEKITQNTWKENKKKNRRYIEKKNKMKYWRAPDSPLTFNLEM